MLVLLTLPLFPVLFFVLPESHVWLAAKVVQYIFIKLYDLIKGRRDEYDYAMTKLNVLAGCVYVRSEREREYTSKIISQKAIITSLQNPFEWD